MRKRKKRRWIRKRNRKRMNRRSRRKRERRRRKRRIKALARPPLGLLRLVLMHRGDA